MNLRQISLGVFVLAGVAALPSSAQSLKPGLWEINSTMHSGNGEMEKAMADMHKQMAAMPPEQRKMMEEAMASHGVSMGDGGSTVKAKVCVSKEMAQRHELPVQRRGSCTEHRSQPGAGKMKSSFTCTNPPSRGEAEFNFTGDSAYTMKMHSTSSMKGKDETMDMESTGRWLGADCGNIKPMPMNPQ